MCRAYVALGLARLLAASACWLAVTKRSGHAEARQTLVKRRDTLLAQLAQLEAKRRAGTVDPNNIPTRRQRIYTELERIYGELDRRALARREAARASPRDPGPAQAGSTSTASP